MSVHGESPSGDSVASERRYHDLYENMPVMYFEMDEEGAVVTVNSFGAEQLGYEPEELVGRSVMNVFHEDDREAVAEQFESLIEKGGVASWEFRKRRKDGSVLWVRETARAIRTGEGRLEVMVVCQDITARKRAEEKRQEAESLVRQLSLQLDEAQERERRRVAVHLHDDVGQALALAHIKLAQLAEDRRSTLPELAEIKNLIQHAIQDTRSLTFELASPVLYELGLADALASLCDRQQRDAKTAFRFERLGLPPSDVDLPERIAVPLYRIASELIHNVRKHAGAKRATITLDLREESVVLRVEDDGRGFDPAAVRPPSRRRTGIGLFSVEQRVDLIGGRLAIHSRPNEGCAIEVTVGLGDDEAAA